MRAFRRIVLTLHRWAGVLLGAYLALIGVTGALVVFRQELQSVSYPAFHRPARSGAATAEPDMVLRAIGDAYPGYRLSGFDWPTYRRDTFLAYISNGAGFRTVFAHPETGRVLGELPYDWIRRLQDLHFDLLGGDAGRRVNGAGALVLVMMVVTGLVVWWPGMARVRDALVVHRRRGWKRLTWEVHGAVGAWLSALLLLWGVTGAYYGFPGVFRSAVNAVSPLTVVRAPESAPSTSPVLPPSVFIAAARREVPEAQFARVVWPFGERGTFLLVMARAIHGDADTTDEVTLYFDQYTGALLLKRDHARRTAGDAVTAWIGPLHFGSFGGLPIKIAWAAAGLALPLLFVSGVVMWTNRR
jgi:uncharacterized iron-regulated membrane protein